MPESCGVDDCESPSRTGIPFCARHLLLLSPKTRNEVVNAYNKGYYRHSEQGRERYRKALVTAVHELTETLSQGRLF